MPAFGTTLKDADVADLITYIKEGKCCVEGENPGPNPWYRAATQKWPVQSGLSGGATGIVKIPSGDSPEGIGVQLIAPNGIRTTVYTDAQGHYEFPKMQTGDYVLRVPTPLLFKPYVVNSVHIDGASKLEDIVLERVSDSDALPATPDIERQLSGAELLWNMPGTAQEKATLQKNCSACHSWNQIFRNRYDEHSWGLIVDRMTQYSGTSLVIRIKGTTTTGGGNQFRHSPRRHFARGSPDAGEVPDARTRPERAGRAAARIPAAARRRHARRGHRVRIAASAARAARRARATRKETSGGRAIRPTWSESSIRRPVS